MKRHPTLWLALLPATGVLAGVLHATSARQAPTPQPKQPPPAASQNARRPNLAEILDPKHTVLLVHEMTNDSHSVNGADYKRGTAFPASEDAKIIPPMQELLALARKKKVRVVYARYTTYADGTTSNNAGIEATSAGPNRPAAPTRVVEGTWGWAQIDEVKPEPGEWIIHKMRRDAFFGTPLDALLRWNGVKTVVLIGSGVTAGVVPTLSSAGNFGYAAVTVSDCIVARDPKRMADSMKFIADNSIVVNHNEVADVWNRAPAAPPLSAGTEPTAGAQEQAANQPRPAAGQGRRGLNLDEILNPKHTVLLVHEMTNDSHSVNGVDYKRGTAFPASEDAKIIPPMQQLLALARAKKVRVVYARYTTYADGSTTNNAGIEATLARAANRPKPPTRVVEDTWGWAQIDEVKPEPGEWIIRKMRPDAFFATPLDALLRWNGVKTIVLIGSGVSVGVVPTLSSAGNLGYATVTVSDCIVARDPARMADSMKFINDLSIVVDHTQVADSWKRR